MTSKRSSVAYLWFGLVWLLSLTAQAQDADSKFILIPIDNLFEGMEKGDSALVSSAFVKDSQLVTVIEKDGNISLRKEVLQPFLKAIATPHNDQWHEPIWGVQINEDGNFAQVWANYAFYLGNKLSHCGVDTFQLIKTKEGWKIFYLADTRKRTGCIVPEGIAKRYTSK